MIWIRINLKALVRFNQCFFYAKINHNILPANISCISNGGIIMMYLKEYFKSLMISYIVALIMLCLSAVTFAYTSINDSLLLVFVFVIVVISNLIGSTMLNRKIKKRGLVTGIAFSLIYFLILYFISIIFYTGFFFNQTLLIYLAITLISGAIGGIIGVNI